MDVHPRPNSGPPGLLVGSSLCARRCGDTGAGRREMRAEACVGLQDDQRVGLGQGISGCGQTVPRHAKGELSRARGLVADQMTGVLARPPDPPTKIGDRRRFAACPAHSCDEKGAAVLERDGRLVGLAILHSACADAHRSNDCFAHETLTVFVRSPADPGVIENLSSWARSAIAQDHTGSGIPQAHLDAVTI